MKPMLIFQLPEGYSNEEKWEAIRTIENGFVKGSLILDSKIKLLSFDKDGNLNYCTR